MSWYRAANGRITPQSATPFALDESARTFFRHYLLGELAWLIGSLLSFWFVF